MGDDVYSKEAMIDLMMKMYEDKTTYQYEDEEEDDVDYDEVVDVNYDDDDYFNAYGEKATRSHSYRTIADKLMRELVANGLETMIMLKDDDVREWWTEVLKEEKRKADEAARKAEAKRKREEDARAKAELISRLTPEERRLLGIKNA